MRVFPLAYAKVGGKHVTGKDTCPVGGELSHKPEDTCALLCDSNAVRENDG
jgi:hypothetical protein